MWWKLRGVSVHRPDTKFHILSHCTKAPTKPDMTVWFQKHIKFLELNVLNSKLHQLSTRLNKSPKNLWYWSKYGHSASYHTHSNPIYILYWPSCKQNWAFNCLVSNAFLCRTHGKTVQQIVMKFFSDTICTLKSNFEPYVSDSYMVFYRHLVTK